MNWWSRLFGKKKQPEPVICNQSPKSQPKQIQPWELYEPFDIRELKILLKLHPECAKRVKALLYLARKEGLAVYIFEGERTWARQKQLYGRGRKNGKIFNKKKVVTYARPGSSYHNYALAVDIVFDGDTSKPGVQWSWDAKNKPETLKDESQERIRAWKRLGSIGTKCGMEWAGNWSRFPEMPHYQLTEGLKIKDLKKLYLKGGKAAVWAEIDRRLAA